MGGHRELPTELPLPELRHLLGSAIAPAIERNEVQIIMALTLLLFIVSSTLNTLLLVLEHRLHRRAAVVGREAGAPAAR